MKNSNKEAQGAKANHTKGKMILRNQLQIAIGEKIIANIDPLFGQVNDENCANAERIIKAWNMHDEVIDVLKKTEWELERLKEQMLKPSEERDSFWISTFFQSTLGGMQRLKEIKELLKQAEQK